MGLLPSDPFMNCSNADLASMYATSRFNGGEGGSVKDKLDIQRYRFTPKEAAACFFLLHPANMQSRAIETPFEWRSASGPKVARMGNA